MSTRSRLVRMKIVNIGCIGPEGLKVELDQIVCLVGGNNTGKTTVLRAYELVAGQMKFDPEHDLCSRAGDTPASVELWVHIPEGIGNIAAKWKAEEDGDLLVRSRWEWAASNGWSGVRSTWDPEKDEYSPEGKAAGLDPVFKSRLPKPLRIGALDDPEGEHGALLTLLVEPLAKSLKNSLNDPESEIAGSLATLEEKLETPVKEASEQLEQLRKQLSSSHGAIFPQLEIDLHLGLGSIQINPDALLKKHSLIRFKEWGDTIDWTKQGTGSQRALFWTLLQVRSGIQSAKDQAAQSEKRRTKLQSDIKKAEKAVEGAQKENTKKTRQEKLGDLQAQLAALDNPNNADDMSSLEAISLPGYMLLIDEPEVALHPNAIRAASQHLYALSDSSAWQVMLTTHSPQFIDPLQDHTTIVRLVRTESNPTPRTFRSDSIEFTEDDKLNLKLLSRFDTGLAEMFFGQYPILVEGDTEFAGFNEAFERKLVDVPLHDRPVLVRARGKSTLRLLMKILRQFQVPFAIVHDADTPRTRTGGRNSAWTVNENILTDIREIRAAGISVKHRVSLPNFEMAHLPVVVDENGNYEEPDSRDKPWTLVNAMRTDPSVAESVAALLTDLCDPSSEEKADFERNDESIEDALQRWASDNKVTDPRIVAEQADS